MMDMLRKRWDGAINEGEWINEKMRRTVMQQV